MLDIIDLNTTVKKKRVNIISGEMAQTREGKPTYQEDHSALKNMKNDKSLWTDELTTEFFKFLWKDLGAFFFCSRHEMEKATLLEI